MPQERDNNGEPQNKGCFNFKLKIDIKVWRKATVFFCRLRRKLSSRKAPTNKYRLRIPDVLKKRKNNH